MKKFSGISYYGGQNGSGHYQKLINHTPKADVHIECFLGMSGVFNNLDMSAATEYYGFDRDKKVDIVTDSDYEHFLEFVLSMLEDWDYASSQLYIMVSHWKDPLFDKYLRGTGKFHHIPFKTMSHRGKQINNGIYINYQPGSIVLSDYSYAGSTFTERQRIKRKVERNYKRIMSMPAMEKKKF